MTQYAYKDVAPADFEFPDGTPTTTLLGSMRNRVTPIGSTKTAGEVDLFVKSIQPDPKCSYVHLISTGALEWYGPNKRGDSFNESARVYFPPSPDTDECREVHLGGGLEEFHNPTFMSNGAVYRDHKSIIADPSNKPQGNVVFAIYNKPMHRGELVIRLDNDKWADDIERLSKGLPLFFSMGCLCAGDVCSVCGRRTSPNDLINRCDHLKHHIKSFMEDGTQVHAITDRPLFYDISRVSCPADKIAFSLAKVASDDSVVIPPAVIPVRFVDRLQGRKADRISLLCKLAAEEVVIDSTGETLPITQPDEEEKRLLCSLSNQAPEVLYILHRRRAVLPFPQFMCLVGGPDMLDNGMLDHIMGLLPSVNRNIVKDKDVAAFIDDGTWEGDCNASPSLVNKVEPLIARYSLDEGPVQVRVVRAVMRKEGKTASDKRIVTPAAGAAATGLAKEYARYQLSFITANPDPRSIRLTLASNRGNFQA